MPDRNSATVGALAIWQYVMAKNLTAYSTMFIEKFGVAPDAEHLFAVGTVIKTCAHKIVGGPTGSMSELFTTTEHFERAWSIATERQNALAAAG